MRRFRASRAFSSSTLAFPASTYMGPSLIRNRHPVGPYSRTMPRALWWSWGGGMFLMSEVPRLARFQLVHSRFPRLHLEREFFINLLVRIHSIIVMIRWTGLARLQLVHSRFSRRHLPHTQLQHDFLKWIVCRPYGRQYHRDIGESLR